jgi:hypothetical protein
MVCSFSLCVEGFYSYRIILIFFQGMAELCLFMLGTSLPPPLFTFLSFLSALNAMSSLNALSATAQSLVATYMEAEFRFTLAIFLLLTFKTLLSLQKLAAL